MRLGLRATAAQEGLGLDASLPMLRARLGEVLATDDCREGLMAFFESAARPGGRASERLSDLRKDVGQILTAEDSPERGDRRGRRRCRRCER